MNLHLLLCRLRHHFWEYSWQRTVRDCPICKRGESRDPDTGRWVKFK